ncbi:MAG: hypothetical protein K1X47_02490 [Cyclobacteriaceae bacterium]|nr:hypothetical protein [Cyclobacteriaceae bacterium]
MKKGWVLLWMLLVAGTVMGQRIGMGKGPSQLSDRLYFGGGGGFGTGTNALGLRYTYFSISPIVGYMITSQLSAGSGITYQSYKYPDAGLSLKQYGVSPFVRYNFEKLFAQVEYNLINSGSFSDPDVRKNYNRLLAGLGYSMPFGSKRGAVNAMAMYDLLYKQPSVFNSPWVFRVFFSF